MKKLIALASLLALASPAFANLVVVSTGPSASDKMDLELCLELQGREPKGDEALFQVNCDARVESYVLKSKLEVLTNRLASPGVSADEKTKLEKAIDFINKKLAENEADFNYLP